MRASRFNVEFQFSKTLFQVYKYCMKSPILDHTGYELIWRIGTVHKVTPNIRKFRYKILHLLLHQLFLVGYGQKL